MAYVNEVFSETSSLFGIRVTVNQRLAGNFAVSIHDTDANEFVGMKIFPGVDAALEFAQGCLAEPVIISE